MAGSAVKDRLVYPLQKRVINPIVMLAHNLGFPPPGDALLETTGRRTRLPRRTPVCDGLDGEVFWLVAQRGRRADWVRNIQANLRRRQSALATAAIAPTTTIQNTTPIHACQPWGR
jgi:F420H(2)-dependent quinone reductase